LWLQRSQITLGEDLAKYPPNQYRASQKYKYTCTARVSSVYSTYNLHGFVEFASAEYMSE